MRQPTKTNSTQDRATASDGEPLVIWVLVYPDFLLLDATAAVQVFSTANDDARDAGLPQPYRIHLISSSGGAIRSCSGISVLTQRLPRGGLTGATLIVSGGRGHEQVIAQASTLRWVTKAYQTVARCGSVCTGAFVLAHAGLLDERCAVTHWQDAGQLQQRYPAVRVQDDAIYVKDGRLYTSAGITAAIDLCLSLVEEDLGRATAQRVAKRLVVFLRRSGGQRQYSSELLAQTSCEGVVAELTRWLKPRLKQTLDVEQMADGLALSVRTLHRKLRTEADVSPAQFLTRMRLDTACSLLERADMSVKQVARQAGFGTEYNLRRAFASTLGVLPTEYRARFG